MGIKKLISLSMLLLSACMSAPRTGTLTPSTMPIPSATASPISSVTAITTAIPSFPTPVSTPALLPEGLAVAYIVNDEIWLWKQSHAQLLAQMEKISVPLLSEDGQWLAFKQSRILPEEKTLADDVWVIRTDGSELHRLLGSDELKPLVGEETLHFIGQIDWRPGSHELLFNTEKQLNGPPERAPAFDLFSVDIAGKLNRLAGPGQGGEFTPSPDGLYAALTTNSRIGILDLESGWQRTLLEFEPVGSGSEYLYTPPVVWDPNGQFIMTLILPPKLYFPEEYAGEPEQVWKLFVNGQTKLVTELQPFARGAAVVFSPNLHYFLYLNDSCVDGMGMLSVYNLVSAEEQPLTCVWELPQWAPDNEHFMYEMDGRWRWGDASENTQRPMEVLNPSTPANVHTRPPFLWVNDEFFLLNFYNEETCTLNVATVAGLVAEIVHAPSDSCPQMDFSLSN